MSKTEQALDILWEEYGPGMHKHAALDYLYQETKQERDEEALTPEFCKLASAFGVDPWELADGVAKNLDKFAAHAKLSSNPDVVQLAQFYMNWAGDIEKKAGLGLIRAGRAALRAGGKAMSRGRGVFRPTFKSVTRTGEAAPTAWQAAKSAWGASRKQTARLAQEGGGSVRRGRKLVKERVTAAQRPPPAKPPAQGPPPRAPAQAPPAQAPAAAPAAAPAQPPPTYAGPPAAAPEAYTRGGGVMYGPGPATAPTRVQPAAAPAATTAGAPAAGQVAAAKPPIDWRSAAIGGGVVGVPAAAYVMGGGGGGGQTPPQRYY